MACDTCKTVAPGKHCPDCGDKRKATLQEAIDEHLEKNYGLKKKESKKKDDKKDGEGKSLLDTILGE